jgi:peroxiredoxin
MSATPLPAGTTAPEFSLLSTPDQRVKLSELRGAPLVLAFYPADFSPVCGDQLVLYNELLPEFRRLGANVVGISVDGPWCHREFASSRHLHFPLLADSHPQGEVARRYGVFHDETGESERALFVLDGEGKVVWSYVSPMGINPGAEGILAALEDLQEKTRAEKQRQAQPREGA